MSPAASPALHLRAGRPDSAHRNLAVNLMVPLVKPTEWPPFLLNASGMSVPRHVCIRPGLCISGDSEEMSRTERHLGSLFLDGPQGLVPHLWNHFSSPEKVFSVFLGRCILHTNIFIEIKALNVYKVVETSYKYDLHSYI